MSYLVLARKYRPATFDEVVGQQHITELLKQSITSGRLAHAYLFCGPRGIGKTSCARILAKSLNCENGPTVTPCNQCSACREITKGTSFDVLEIDGASNRGIDEIRTLRENVKFAPNFGRYKIYIVDEVHMLTMEAFNALLKTLEEPPEHVKFILATTDPNKVPATIISRCQKFDFKRVTVKVLVETLQQVCAKENFHIEPDALYVIAKAAQGGFRDALSILDQVGALTDQDVKSGDIFGMLGLVESELLFQLTDALGGKDCSQALSVLDAILDKGKDIKQLSRDLVEHFRNLMVMKIGGKMLGGLLDYPTATKELYLTQADRFSLAEILEAIDVLIEAQDVARVTESLRIPLEIAFAKMTYTREGGTHPLPAPLRIAAGPTQKPAAVSPVSPEPSPILKNQKGELNLGFAKTPAVAVAPPMVTTEIFSAASVSSPSLNKAPGPAVTLDEIKRTWDTLTYAVSREKMSIATYLQEGSPFSWDGTRLTIGFAKEYEFHKESLESNDYVKLVERIFADKLQAKILIAYKIVEGAKPAAPAEVDEPLIKTALEAFQGKIVSRWHQE